MVKHNDTTYALARTGRKLHLAVEEQRTLCGVAINYSVPDGRYSYDVGDGWLRFMQLCPRCESKVER